VEDYHQHIADHPKVECIYIELGTESRPEVLARELKMPFAFIEAQGLGREVMKYKGHVEPEYVLVDLEGNFLEQGDFEVINRIKSLPKRNQLK